MNGLLKNAGTLLLLGGLALVGYYVFTSGTVVPPPRAVVGRSAVSWELRQRMALTAYQRDVILFGYGLAIGGALCLAFGQAMTQKQARSPRQEKTPS